jgi:hypothetical protein
MTPATPTPRAGFHTCHSSRVPTTRTFHDAGPSKTTIGSKNVDNRFNIQSTATITIPTVTEQRCLQTTPIVYRPPSTVYRHNAIHRVLQTPFHGGARAPLGGHNVHSQARPHFGGTPSLLPAIHGQRPQRRIGMSMLSGLQRWARTLFAGSVGIPRTPHGPGLCQAT